MKTKLILELGCNHQGDVVIAKKMIDQAVILGAYAVKFQKRYLDDMPNELRNKKRNLVNSFGETYYEHRKVLEFNNEEMAELQDYTIKSGLFFMCTAFDEQSIYDLASIGCKYIKLPSQLYSDEQPRNVLLQIRDYISDIKILVSTGMHNAEEIFNSWWINYADILFHCISVYPNCITNMNLQTLKDLCEIRSGKAVGYSSHEHEGMGIKYAVLCGAEYIERHFTLDKELKGSDHGTVSSDSAEIKRIVSDIEWAENILGKDDRECSLKERAVRKIYRRF
jgi:sialic acid synthase SpsE